MHKLYAFLGPLSSQAECKSCRLCEEHVGLVYLLGPEADVVSRHGLQVVRSREDVKYLERTTSGQCVAFDSESGTCRIYAHRPLCCRLYPLDLMKIEGVVWWVIHAECPIAQRFERERRLEVLAAMTRAMESAISEEELRGWLVEDRLSQQVEAFSFDTAKTIKLRPYGEPLAFPRA